MTNPSGSRADVVEFARQEAAAVFGVWDAGGDFMRRRVEALAAIDALAERHARSAAMFDQITRLQGAGFSAFCEHHAALIEQWDGQLARDAEAEERASGARRRRQHHVRRVFR